MNPLTKNELALLKSLVESLKFETDKAENNGGFVAKSYLIEKAGKILTIAKSL